jgi:hypothetical protein
MSTRKPIKKEDVAAANLRAMEKNLKRGKDRMGNTAGVDWTSVNDLPNGNGGFGAGGSFLMGGAVACGGF